MQAQIIRKSPPVPVSGMGDGRWEINIYLKYSHNSPTEPIRIWITSVIG